MENIVIAVDGPAGAGKSTIAKKIAVKMKLEYIDSGAFYRAITKKILDSKLKIDDYKGIKKLLDLLEIKLENGAVSIDTVDMNPYLRIKEVAENVSFVSNNIDVRKKVNQYLKQYSLNKSVIMDGRDIGTIVFPDAHYKFYLDASVDIRAGRRLQEGNYKTTIDELKQQIIIRDQNDRNKEYGALKIAEDAVYIDTSEMTIDEVVNNILKRIQK